MICPTTGEHFDPAGLVPTGLPGFRWALCPHCDVMNRPRGHPEYDPKRPQPHGIETNAFASLMSLARLANHLRIYRRNL